jgi:adenylate kinase family enzyme
MTYSFLGKLAKGFMDEGKLVPDHVMIGMIKSHINAPEPKKHGIYI